MESSIESIVIGVRFSKVGKIYHFESNGMVDLKPGDNVVVETSRGWQLGQVAQVLDDIEKPPEGWKSIDRRATPRDLLLRQMWQQKESEVVESCKNRAKDLNLVGIKIVSAEYSFDGSRLTLLFSSETEEKYDLKSLRGDMQKMFAPSQVEMRQIGPRDVAKQQCGMGACGKETRCCCSFLTEFSSISIRMAKEQGISLTPSEITGMCGRLRCCLIYEYDQYVDARKSLPKRNKRVRTPDGEGRVVDVVPLRDSVLVELPEVGVREFLGTDVTVLEGEAARPAESMPARGDAAPVVTQPSEIDQVLSGEEVVPDRVEGVGDSGLLGPMDAESQQRPQRRDNRPRNSGGPRGDAGKQQPRERGTPGRGDQGQQGRGQQNRGPQNPNQQNRGQQNRGPQDPAAPQQGNQPPRDRGRQDRNQQGRGAPGNASSERGASSERSASSDRGVSQEKGPSQELGVQEQARQGERRASNDRSSRRRNQSGRGRGPKSSQDQGGANQGSNDQGKSNPPPERNDSDSGEKNE